MLAASFVWYNCSIITDNYWINETQSVQEDDNATNNSDGYRIISDINEKNDSIVAPVDPLMRVAFVALLLHVLIVGGGMLSSFYFNIFKLD